MAMPSLQNLRREGICDVYRPVAGNGHIVAEVRFAWELGANLAIPCRKIEALEVTANCMTWAIDAETRHIIRADP